MNTDQETTVFVMLFLWLNKHVETMSNRENSESLPRKEMPGMLRDCANLHDRLVNGLARHGWITGLTPVDSWCLRRGARGYGLRPSSLKPSSYWVAHWGWMGSSQDKQILGAGFSLLCFCRFWVWHVFGIYNFDPTELCTICNRKKAEIHIFNMFFWKNTPGLTSIGNCFHALTWNPGMAGNLSPIPGSLAALVSAVCPSSHRAPLQWLPVASAWTAWCWNFAAQQWKRQLWCWWYDLQRLKGYFCRTSFFIILYKPWHSMAQTCPDKCQKKTSWLAI